MVISVYLLVLVRVLHLHCTLDKAPHHVTVMCHHHLRLLVHLQYNLMIVLLSRHCYKTN